MKTVTQIAAEHQLHPNLVSKWRQEFLAEAPSLFEQKNTQNDMIQVYEQRVASLYEQVGRLTIERDWLKKKSGLEPDAL